MATLTLKDVKIEIPNYFTIKPTDSDIVEWLEYNLGDRSDIKLLNPLIELELSDCKISVGNANINGKTFVF